MCAASPHTIPSSTWVQAYTAADAAARKSLRAAFEIRSKDLGFSRVALDTALKLLACGGDIKRVADRLNILPAAVRFHIREYAKQGIDLRPEAPVTKSKILREDSIRFLSFVSKKLCLSSISVARYSDCGKLQKTLSYQEVDELFFAHALSYTSRCWGKPLTIGACRMLYRLAASKRPTNAETLFCFICTRAKPCLRRIRHLFRYLETIVSRNWRKPKEKQYFELLPAFLPRPDFPAAPPETIPIDRRPIPPNTQLRFELENLARRDFFGRARPVLPRQHAPPH